VTCSYLGVKKYSLNLNKTWNIECIITKYLRESCLLEYRPAMIARITTRSLASSRNSNHRYIRRSWIEISLHGAQQCLHLSMQIRRKRIVSTLKRMCFWFVPTGSNQSTFGRKNCTSYLMNRMTIWSLLGSMCWVLKRSTLRRVKARGWI
jgi:hypothetical protein